jgi:hypothetical protein
MTQCSDGSWCCGSQNQTDCCDKNLGFKLESSIAPFASSTASATVTLSSATATAMLSNTTSSSSPSESTNSPSSTSANKSLGIGLGVALGVVLLAVVILAFMLYRRHRTQRRRKDQGIAAPDIIVPSFPAGHEVPQPVKIHEVPHFKEPVEMDGSGGTRRANGGSGRPF